MSEQQGGAGSLYARAAPGSPACPALYRPYPICLGLWGNPREKRVTSLPRSKNPSVLHKPWMLPRVQGSGLTRVVLVPSRDGT